MISFLFDLRLLHAYVLICRGCLLLSIVGFMPKWFVDLMSSSKVFRFVSDSMIFIYASHLIVCQQIGVPVAKGLLATAWFKENPILIVGCVLTEVGIIVTFCLFLRWITIKLYNDYFLARRRMTYFSKGL